MSGHSKWSKIKRQKGVSDIKKGQLFTKLGRELMVAVREGGPDPERNFRLRLAIQKCRDNNMPMDNVNSAIRKASGETGGAALTETSFEGYGPGGAAILVQALTDNRNRTLQEIRSIFSRGGGSLAEAGGVAWLFESRGVIVVEAGRTSPEDIALWAIDAGADDFKIEKDSLEIYTQPAKLEPVRKALEQQHNVVIASAELSMIPKTTLELGEEEALKVLKLLDRLEELDDVQRVFSNVDFTDAVMERLRAKAV